MARSTATRQDDLDLRHCGPVARSDRGRRSARSGSSWRSCRPIALNLLVRGKAAHVRNEFGEQLPENLDVLASALRAGHSLAGAMGVVADEAPEPSKREFTPRRHRRAARDSARRGARGDGEANAEHRHGPGGGPRARPARGRRKHGGGARPGDENIRARMDVRRLVKVLTAQGKFSCWSSSRGAGRDLPVPPPRQPDQLDPLFHETIGQVCGDHGDRHGDRGLLHHPANRHDRALIMIHFVLIIGLFLLAIAVTMVIRGAQHAGRGSSETIEQIPPTGSPARSRRPPRRRSRDRASVRDWTT